jgi:hypothetical protein
VDVHILEPQAPHGSPGQVDPPAGPIQEGYLAARPEDGQRNTRKTDAGTNVEESGRRARVKPSEGKYKRIG